MADAWGRGTRGVCVRTCESVVFTAFFEPPDRGLTPDTQAETDRFVRGALDREYEAALLKAGRAVRSGPDAA